MKRSEWDGDGRAASCYQRLQGAPGVIFTSISSIGIQWAQPEVEGGFRLLLLSTEAASLLFPSDQLFNIHRRLNHL